MAISFIRRVIKSLKKRYPMSVVFRRIWASDFDATTGTKTQNVQSWTIERAVVSPDTGVRDFAYDLAFIAANKNFTYGATFDESTRSLILDADDLPSDFVPTVNDYVLIDFQVYQVKQADIYDGAAYLITALHISGDEAENIKRVSVQSDLGINQVVDGEIQ